jgi:hypothetical protein
MPNNIVNQIIETTGTDRIQEMLNQIPRQIFDQKEKVRNLRDGYKEAEENRAMREAELLSDLSAEVNPSTGKPMYSNAESRQAALMSRKASDSDYQDAAHDAKQRELALNQAQDELDMLFDRRAVLMKALEKGTAELNLWAMYYRQEAAEAETQEAQRELKKAS